MIRCLFYVEELNRGGIETFCMNVLRAADPKEISFSFLVLKEGRYDFSAEAERLGASVFYLLNSDDGSYQNLSRAGKLRLQCSRMREWCACHAREFDVLHFNASHLGNAYPLIATAKKAGFGNIVLHAHSSADSNGLNRTLHLLLRGCVGMLGLSEKLACSTEAGEWMYGRGARFVVVNNGIDLEHYGFSIEKRREIRERLGIDQQRKVFVYPARLTKMKNQAFLLQVIKECIDGGERPLLLLCGRGEEEEALRSECKRLGVDAAVRFLGVRKDMDAILSASDCFLFPSLYEGLPVAAVEAQANGLPLVLSSNISHETVMSDKTVVLDLSAGALAWGRRGIALMSRRHDAARYTQQFYAYDIDVVVSQLEGIYEKGRLVHGSKER